MEANAVCSKDKYLEEVKNTAEGYFKRGEFFCSEAVLQTLNDALGQPFSPEITRMASSFPIGLGKAQCLCGAVSGGEMALGIVYGRVHGEAMDPKMFELSKDLHDFIKKEYGSTCCRVITKKWNGDNFMSPERKEHCIKITGEVAEWVADKLIDDGKMEIK
ncbi:C-GCAxxG-C-C family protein [Metaclostridioides mangenotii]|jgi:C_GCAxxG_C_C family probable redox protein|uniref:C_GCAxxG_C_C family probable redox protein n=1 Tax=Metaclostridioides mangenotii TaxID=1540 RepID=A0ABS4EBD1_9FIRM|nr:C-GCAxxG-C-C family protein [Clostridioides mangenotii]MBP1855233.1 C_GCAxxG_C_C family probable redox protein [Clostridioides mangenotii]